MSTLYELKGQWQNLQEAMSFSGDEESKNIIQEAINSIDGSIEEKADGYAKVIKNIEADITALKAEQDRLSDRKKSLERHKDNMREALQQAMTETGKTNIKTSLFTFAIRQSAPAVETGEGFVAWAEANAKEYLKYSVDVNKKAIAEALKAGKDIPCAAFAEPKQSLTIR